ncbi:MAG: hypothetical protein AAGB15_00330 [Pseudomonadota bacterium]
MRHTAQFLALTAALLAAPGPASAQAADCLREFDVLAQGDGTRAFDCLLELSRELAEARAENDSLHQRLEAIDRLIQGQVGHVHAARDDELYPPKPHRHSAFATSEDVAAATVPSGAVMAFDLVSCPAGWQPFSEGQSRMIVGAKFPGVSVSGRMGRNENGTPLVEYSYREHGGLERVTLTPAQMPTHAHPGSTFDDGRVLTHERPETFTAQSGRDYNMRWVENGSIAVAPEGGGASHNNMPPYLALFLCRKD